MPLPYPESDQAEFHLESPPQNASSPSHSLIRPPHRSELLPPASHNVRLRLQAVKTEEQPVRPAVQVRRQRNRANHSGDVRLGEHSPGTTIATLKAVDVLLPGAAEADV